MKPLNIAVIGAGLIGRNHAGLVNNHPACQLCAIADPSPSANDFAQQLGTTWYGSLDEVIASGRADGIILATPNHLHVDQALQCIEARLPTLIEKPVSHTISEGQRLLAAAMKSDVPLLVGHHRMHSPLMSKAKEVIGSGILGNLVAVNGNALFYKPDAYFAAGPWRTQPGGGPILINMTHEIGNLRYLCGDVVSVQAIASNKQRGYAVEDTVGILLMFASGAIGTFILSDTAGSAQSWEQTARENPDYASYQDEDCYHITGTDGSLSVPTLRIRHFPDKAGRSWYKPMQYAVAEPACKDPLEQQLNHFCAVLLGDAEPLVTVRDGLQNVMVTEAIVKASQSGQTVRV